MANGLLSDWMSGTGVYGTPSAIDPSVGVPYADVRAAQLGALGNIGSLLLAAGQPMTGAQRAQFLGQIGPQLSGMQTDIYNAAQRRLMQAQFQDQMAARASREALVTEAKDDPLAFEKKYGFSPIGLAPDALSSLVSKVKETQALAGPETLALNKAQQAMLGGGQISPETALASGGGPTIENAAKMQPSSGMTDYEKLLRGGRAAVSLGTPSGLSVGKTYLELAKMFKPDYTSVAPGAAVIDQATGKVIYKAEEKTPATPDITNYRFAVDQDIKAGKTPQSFADWLEAERKSKGTTINVDTKGQQFAQELAMKLGTDAVGAAQNAVSDMAAINRSRELLDQGVITGFAAGGRLMLSQAAAAAGLVDENDPRIKNTPQLVAGLAQRTLKASEMLKGVASESDMALLKKASGADQDISEAAIREILDTAEKVNKKIIEKGKKSAGILSKQAGVYGELYEVPEPETYRPVKIQRTVTDPNNPSKTISVTGIKGTDGKYYATVGGSKFLIEE